MHNLFPNISADGFFFVANQFTFVGEEGGEEKTDLRIISHDNIKVSAR